MHSISRFLAAAAVATVFAASAASAAPIRWSTSLHDTEGFLAVNQGAGNGGFDFPLHDFYVSLTFYGDTTNFFDDTANGVRLFAATADPTVTFVNSGGEVFHPVLETEPNRIFAVGSGQYDGIVAYGSIEGGLVNLGNGISGPGLAGYTGLTSVGPTAVTLNNEDGDASLEFQNGNELFFTSWGGATFEAVLLGTGTVEDPLLPTEPVAPGGGFTFDFSATGGQPVYVDPFVATGYDFSIEAGNPLITQAMFPVVGASLYDIYALGDLGTLLFEDVAAGVVIDFTSLDGYENGIAGFSLRGIDVSGGLDPDDPEAFVTALWFAEDGEVNLTQTPITAYVPEPSTWAMLIMGFAAMGGVLRTRRRELVAA